MNISPYEQLVIEKVSYIKSSISRKADRDVTLIAVTKGFGQEAVKAADKAGIPDLGENYAQEIQTKSQGYRGSFLWHFIGQLQTNKVRKICGVVGMWHSVTSLKLAGEIAKRSPGAPVLIQVNSGGPANQMGVSEHDLPAMVESIRNLDLHVRGLMTMGIAGDPDGTRSVFSKLRELADDLELEDCSMGMSADMDIALECGTTMLRIGKGIFGNRVN